MTSVVELHQVSREYEGTYGSIALRDCNLTVNSGDFLTVVGPSGSGKTTLLNIIGLLDSPTSGKYFLRGRDTSVVSEKARSRMRGEMVGFVFQSFQLLEQRSCLDNVMLADLYTGANERDSRARASKALESVGLLGREESLPTELSGGQRQRVAIARALAGNPAILLCDEPTGNLDSSTAESILSLFLALNAAGATIMLITHDRSVAALGNRKVMMLDGTLTEPDQADAP